MSEPLPPFSGDTPRCTKCGNKGAHTDYRAYGHCHHDADIVTDDYDPNPRLCRTCNRCGHGWDEATLD